MKPDDLLSAINNRFTRVCCSRLILKRFGRTECRVSYCTRVSEHDSLYRVRPTDGDVVTYPYGTTRTLIVILNLYTYINTHTYMYGVNDIQ